jgi:hypothetical protein
VLGANTSASNEVKQAEVLKSGGQNKVGCLAMREWSF